MALMRPSATFLPVSIARSSVSPGTWRKITRRDEDSFSSSSSSSVMVSEESGGCGCGCLC